MERRATAGKRVYPKRVSRVRISVAPQVKTLILKQYLDEFSVFSLLRGLPSTLKKSSQCRKLEENMPYLGKKSDEII